MQIATLLRDITATYQHDPEYIWQDDAACAFQPHTLFEVAREGDPITKGLTSLAEIQDLNETNLRAGQKICNTCPVWDLCYTSANPGGKGAIGDFDYTMRAGIMPKRHNVTPLGRPAKSQTCPKGHVDWGTDNNGHRRCNTCTHERSVFQAERQKALRAAEGRTKRQLEGVQRGVECKYGHDQWKPRAAKQRGSWHCIPCKRASDAEYKRKVREAAKVEG